MDEYFVGLIGSHYLITHLYQENKTSELRLWKGKQKWLLYLRDSRGNKCLSGQLPHEVMITDKYVIIILFSSGGQLLIA